MTQIDPKDRNKTKIICTLGPATESPEMIGRLMDVGAQIFRINMSHAKHEWVRGLVSAIRSGAIERQLQIGVLFDLTGPSIRTGELPVPFALVNGDVVEFRKEGVDASVEYSTTVNYAGLMDDVSVGNKLIVDNGALEMLIDRVDLDRILCTCKTPGPLGSRRHINLPGVRLNLPAMTAKDHKDLALAVELKADYIAGSFVRDGAHVVELRNAMKALAGDAQIIAKVEDQEAIRNMDAIIEASDLIMVARGDLGTEVEFEELPFLQSKLVKRCHELGRRVIVATHMLESMIQNPTPTRAEVTDVKNAVFEEADAIMLSGETSVGRYPERCVEAMVRVASLTERMGTAGFGETVILRDERQKTAKAAVMLADSLTDACLVVLTRRGSLSTTVGMLRPKHARIFAVTPTAEICRQLVLTRAVEPIQMEFSAKIEETVQRVTRVLLESGRVKAGSPVVVVADIQSDNFVANSILVHHA